MFFRFAILFVAGLSGFANAQEPAQTPKESLESVAQPELAAELVAMGVEDQKYRTLLHEHMLKSASEPKSVSDSDLKKLVEKQNELDAKNLARLEEIIKLHGWPGNRLVGKEACSAAFLILQHSELETQLKHLKTFREAVKKGEARGQDLALLEDRVLMRQGKKQIYGSQLQVVDGKPVLYPIEDEEHVDERRASVGLPPLKEYLKHFNLDYAPTKK